VTFDLVIARQRESDDPKSWNLQRIFGLFPRLEERQQQLADRLQQLRTAWAADQQRELEISEGLAPLRENLATLETAEAEARSSSDSGRWQGLQGELEAADRELSAARAQRDALVAERRERALAAERFSSQLQALAGEEQRLGQAVTALVAERQLWKEQHQQGLARRSELEARQAELQERFGERRRARDGAEAQLASQRQALQQRTWERQRLGDGHLCVDGGHPADGKRLREHCHGSSST
jgi:chromosome segregation protein